MNILCVLYVVYKKDVHVARASMFFWQESVIVCVCVLCVCCSSTSPGDKLIATRAFIRKQHRNKPSEESKVFKGFVLKRNELC